MATSKELRKPVNTLRCGNIKAAIWQNISRNGTFLAAVRSARLEYEARRVCYTLEHSTMDKPQIAALIRRWRDMALEAGKDERIINSPLSAHRIDSAETALSVALEETDEALVSGEYKVVGGEVDELLSSQKLPTLDHESQSYKR